MADGDPVIDARYAAQFQRGYSGPAEAPAAAKTVTPSTRPDPVRIPEGASTRTAPNPDPPTVIARPLPDDEAGDVDEPPTRTTAWVEWSLLAVGTLLVAAAALVFWQSATDTGAFTGSYDAAEQVFASVRGTLPGPLFVAGVVGLAVGVVVRALRPR